MTAIRWSQVPTAASPLKLRQRPVGAQEDVLRQVGGVLVVADEAVAELVDGPAMPDHEFVERLPPPGDARRHERPVVERGKFVV